MKKNVQSWLLKALDDPIVKILLMNSHLTKIQLETLLIDILSENMAGKPLTNEKKAHFRIMRQKISRGSFNRSLRQAKGNVIKAMYTMILLGYVGLFDNTTFDPYIEIANKLDKYMKAYINKRQEGIETPEYLKGIEAMQEKLITSLEELSNS
ncbi:MAG: hypothetical protein PVH12_02215 [Candidatus Bathyarchaeota archaeon]|jgi:hypothetical protein